MKLEWGAKGQRYGWWPLLAGGGRGIANRRSIHYPKASPLSVPSSLELSITAHSQVSLSSLLTVLWAHQTLQIGLFQISERVWMSVFICYCCLILCTPNWYMLDFEPLSTLSWNCSSLSTGFSVFNLPSFNKFSTFFQSVIFKIKSLN